MESLAIIKKIKEKKSLANLDDDFILERLEYYLRKNNIKGKIKEVNERSAIIKKIIKEIRNELNRIYGCFNLNNELSLESNSSTRERINIYPKLYNDIFKITGKPNIIVDLGCGLNPLSYKYINFKCKYIVSEFNKKDCERLRTYFKENNINGEVLQINLTNFSKLPIGDICFLFKVLDSIETKGHKIAERIIRELNCKYIVASFSTTTLHGNQMKYPRRTWFEVMLKRVGKEYSRLDYKNEVFYIIKV